MFYVIDMLKTRVVCICSHVYFCSFESSDFSECHQCSGSRSKKGRGVSGGNVVTNRDG